MSQTRPSTSRARTASVPANTRSGQDTGAAGAAPGAEAAPPGGAAGAVADPALPPEPLTRRPRRRRDCESGPAASEEDAAVSTGGSPSRPAPWVASAAPAAPAACEPAQDSSQRSSLSHARSCARPAAALAPCARPHVQASTRRPQGHRALTERRQAPGDAAGQRPGWQPMSHACAHAGRARRQSAPHRNRCSTGVARDSSNSANAPPAAATTLSAAPGHPIARRSPAAAVASWPPHARPMLSARASAPPASAPRPAAAAPAPPGPLSSAAASAHPSRTWLPPQKQAPAACPVLSHPHPPSWQSPAGRRAQGCAQSRRAPHGSAQSPHGPARAWHARAHRCLPQVRSAPHGSAQAHRRGAEHGCGRTLCRPTHGTLAATRQGGQGAGSWQGAGQGWSQRGRGRPQGREHGGHGPAWQVWLAGGWWQPLGRPQGRRHGGGAAVSPQATTVVSAPQAHDTAVLTGQRGHRPGWHLAPHACRPQASVRPHGSAHSRHGAPSQQRRPHAWRPHEQSRSHLARQRNRVPSRGRIDSERPHRQRQRTLGPGRAGAPPSESSSAEPFAEGAAPARVTLPPSSSSSSSSSSEPGPAAAAAATARDRAASLAALASSAVAPTLSPAPARLTADDTASARRSARLASPAPAPAPTWAAAAPARALAHSGRGHGGHGPGWHAARQAWRHDRSGRRQGSPHVWGGSQPSGWGRSSLPQKHVYAAGYSWPPNTAPQAGQAKPPCGSPAVRAAAVRPPSQRCTHARCISEKQSSHCQTSSRGPGAPFVHNPQASVPDPSGEHSAGSRSRPPGRGCFSVPSDEEAPGTVPAGAAGAAVGIRLAMAEATAAPAPRPRPAPLPLPAPDMANCDPGPGAVGAASGRQALRWLAGQLPAGFGSNAAAPPALVDLDLRASHHLRWLSTRQGSAALCPSGALMPRRPCSHSVSAPHASGLPQPDCPVGFPWPAPPCAARVWTAHTTARLVQPTARRRAAGHRARHGR